MLFGRLCLRLYLQIWSPPRGGGPGGGLTIFYQDNLYKAHKIKELSLCNSTIETCVAQLSRKDLPYPEGHFIVGVYWPHSDTIEIFTISLQSCSKFLISESYKTKQLL